MANKFREKLADKRSKNEYEEFSRHLKKQLNFIK
jgi:hypothetical protein